MVVQAAFSLIPRQIGDFYKYRGIRPLLVSQGNKRKVDLLVTKKSRVSRIKVVSNLDPALRAGLGGAKNYQPCATLVDIVCSAQNLDFGRAGVDRYVFFSIGLIPPPPVSP